MEELAINLVGGIPAQLAVFLLSMIPVVELRGALPIALVAYDLPLGQAFVIVIIGNMIPAFLIIFGWDSLVKFTERYWPWLHRTMQKLEEKTQGKWDKKIETYGPLALTLFVAIPLPLSGVWTGALAAWLFKLSKIRAMISIFFGVLLASITMALLTLGGLKFF